MGMGDAVTVVQVKEAATPADEQPEREQRDYHAYARLGAGLHRLWEVCLEKDDRQAEREQARGMAESPREPQAGCVPCRSVAAGCDQRRDGGEVVRIARMAEAQHDRDDDDERERRAVGEVGDPVVESEHVNSLSGGPARSWRDRRQG